jgi:predicted  nucleic acid-binding Zn-ribbon protein
MERYGYTLVATGAVDESTRSDGMEDIIDGLHTGLYTKGERYGPSARMRVGQFWAGGPERLEGKALELVVVSETTVHGIIWNNRTGQSVEIGDALWTSPATHGEHGGGNVFVGAPHEIVDAIEEDSELLGVTADSHSRERGRPINECAVVEKFRRCILPPRQPVTASWEQMQGDIEVYTDGTFKTEATVTQWAQGSETKSAAAAVVVITGEESRGWRIVNGVEMNSAYDAEVVALAVARCLAPETTIYTDCKSAMAAMQEDQHRTGIAHIGAIAKGTGVIDKVKAHAERRKRTYEWTKEEAGNVKADAVANGRAEEVGVQLCRTSLSRAIAATMPLVWRNKDGNVRLDAGVAQRCMRYTDKRDQARAEADPPRQPRWEGVTNRLGSAMWTSQACSCAMAVRIMWDKHVTGENLLKWKSKDTHRCTACGALSSQKHIISECQRPGAAGIRLAAIEKVREEAGKSKDKVRDTVREILKLFHHEEAHTIWTGMWTVAVQKAISDSCPWQLSRREYAQVVKCLRHLAEGTLALYRLAGPRQIRKRKRETNTPTNQQRQDSTGTPQDNLAGRDDEGRTGPEEWRSEMLTFDKRVYDR